VQRSAIYSIMEPSADLVARTIDSCRGILLHADTRSKPVAMPILGTATDTPFGNDQFVLATSELSLTQGEKERIAGFRRCERLPAYCIATADFARERHKPPLLLVDNHNVVNPTWWDFDSGFSAMRDSLRITNKITAKSGAPPTMVVMVLRPKAEDYSDEEMMALGRTIETATSDIFLVSYNSAGKYKNQDVLVGGEDWAIKLEGKPETPYQAFQAFRDEGPAVASVMRHEISHVASHAFKIRDAAKIVVRYNDLGTAEHVRELLDDVIMRFDRAEGIASTDLDA
jgi:hypothetical protein